LPYLCLDRAFPRISPYAEMALLVDIENDEVSKSREIALGVVDELQRIQYFMSLDHQRYRPARGSKTHFVTSGAVGDAKNGHHQRSTCRNQIIMRQIKLAHMTTSTPIEAYL